MQQMQAGIHKLHDSLNHHPQICVLLKSRKMATEISYCFFHSNKLQIYFSDSIFYVESEFTNGNRVKPLYKKIKQIL